MFSVCYSIVAVVDSDLFVFGDNSCSIAAAP
jgi:hypothetical protein